MNCNEVGVWLHGYLDGELDLPQTIAIDRHLEGCVACSRAYQNQRGLSHSIRAANLQYTCPDHVRSRIASLARPVAAKSAAATQVPRAWLAMAASVLLLVAISLLARPLIVARSSRNAIAQEVVACHVRSLQADHLTDVDSNDQHQVKPWFAGKLDFAPGVMDFSSEGFPLVGGRLDYLQHRSVAAVVYRRRQHVINLFIWPSDSSTVGMRLESNNGYQLVHWTLRGTAYWAISDLNLSELHQFAELVGSSVGTPKDGAD